MEPRGGRPMPEHQLHQPDVLRARREVEGRLAQLVRRQRHATLEELPRGLHEGVLFVQGFGYDGTD